MIILLIRGGLAVEHEVTQARAYGWNLVEFPEYPGKLWKRMRALEHGGPPVYREQRSKPKSPSTRPWTDTTPSTTFEFLDRLRR